VFKQTEALAKAAQAKNRFATEDSNAAKSEMNFDGSVKEANVSIGEQIKKLQLLTSELNNLKRPQTVAPANSNSPTPTGFGEQFTNLSSYQEKLQLVQKTISDLQKKTNLPLKDIGRELGKSFPELLQDTNLVSTAIQNLSNEARGLSASFKPVQQTIAEVNAALSELQARGKINLAGTPAEVSASLQDTIKEVSAQTGANYEDVAAGLQRMGVSAKDAQAALSVVNKELTNPSAAQYAQRLQVLQGELASLSTAKAGTSGFEGQFQGLATYQEQLKLVQTTIANLQKSTNLPFKDVGAE